MTEPLDMEVEPTSCPEPGCEFVAASPRGLSRHLTVTHGRQSAHTRRQAARADQGPEPASRGHSIPSGDGEPPPDEPGGKGSPPAQDSPYRADETTPAAPDSEGRAWWRQLWTPKGERAPRPPRTSRAQPGGPRQPLDELAGWVYGHVGGSIARSTGPYVPVGRVMEMQTVSIGVLFDEAAAGTRVDRVLQPLVRGGKRWRKVGNAVALPVMTALAVRNPALLGLEVRRTVDGQESVALSGPMAQEYYSVWEQNALEMAQGFERTEQRRRDIRRELEHVPFLAPVIEAGGDPVLWLIAQTFAPPEQPGDEPAASPANNGRVTA